MAHIHPTVTTLPASSLRRGAVEAAFGWMNPFNVRDYSQKSLGKR